MKGLVYKYTCFHTQKKWAKAGMKLEIATSLIWNLFYAQIVTLKQQGPCNNVICSEIVDFRPTAISAEHNWK